MMLLMVSLMTSMMMLLMPSLMTFLLLLMMSLIMMPMTLLMRLLMLIYVYGDAVDGVANAFKVASGVAE